MNSFRSLAVSVRRTVCKSSSSALQIGPTTVRMPLYQKADAFGIMAGVAAAGALAGVGKLWWDSSSSAVTKEKLLSLYDELALVTQEVLVELQKKEAQALAAAEEREESIDANQLKAALKERFFEAMNAIEFQLFQQRGWDQKVVGQALMELQADPQVRERMMRLEQIVQRSVGCFAVDVPESLTREKVLAIVEDILACMTSAMEETLAELKAKGVTANMNDCVDQWQPQYVQKVNQRLQEKHAQHDITEELLHAAIAKYQSDKQFLHKLQKLHLDQEQLFAKMGLNPQF